MSILKKIEELIAHLYDSLDEELKNNDCIDYSSLEMAIRNKENCSWQEAKNLIHLLWFNNTDNILILFSKIDNTTAPVEVKRILIEAEKIAKEKAKKE